ncbi:hypothetical protein [Pseudogemmobacter faecipullorum]|uniref:Uncharacterized protein n=1 Tax=Pseudogemmobacter faecipullorum TaxID=2755041 RepID=A0ABS8CSH6_9RHOB|nr:hypothetical protein [Pseudogemmobacter faecipullorum]MCB5412354.1 hypothetical protein [Pseudogemmobacter faecipullorum]
MSPSHLLQNQRGCSKSFDDGHWYVEGRGTEQDHLHAANSLAVIANAYAGIYAKAAGITVEEAREIMKAETYFDGPAALEAGFATSIEDDGDEAEPAAFDYRIYQHAPKRLLAAAGALQRKRPRASVLAMMVGAEPPKARGAKAMAAKIKPAPRGKVTAKTAAEEEEDPNLEENEDPEAELDEEDLESEGGNLDEEDLDAEEEDEPTASAPAEALAIYRMCTRSGLTNGEAEEFISRGLTCVQAVAELNGKGSKVNTRNHAPRARILRDERDTRRAGMTAALAAQIGRQREVSGPGRQYMDMSIMDMIAMSIRASRLAAHCGPEDGCDDGREPHHQRFPGDLPERSEQAAAGKIPAGRADLQGDLAPEELPRLPPHAAGSYR